MSIYREIVQGEQLNCSSSKPLYSFGHQQRFNYSQYKSLNDNFYEIPSSKSKRSAGFGYGDKYNFSKSVKKNPAPNQYQIKSIFDSKNSGKTMGTSRDKMKQNGILGNLNKNPGPGNYESNPTTLSNIKYSMRPNTNGGFLSKFDKNPGPGQYEKIDSMNRTGKFPISKFRTYGVPIINPQSNARGLGLNVPGPGAYYPKSTMRDHVTSKFNAELGNTFTHDDRNRAQIKDPKNPGPGSYRLPTDFGHYEKTTKTLMSARNTMRTDMS